MSTETRGLTQNQVLVLVCLFPFAPTSLVFCLSLFFVPQGGLTFMAVLLGFLALLLRWDACAQWRRWGNGCRPQLPLNLLWPQAFLGFPTWLLPSVPQVQGQWHLPQTLITISCWFHETHMYSLILVELNSLQLDFLIVPSVFCQDPDWYESGL